MAMPGQSAKLNVCVCYKITKLNVRRMYHSYSIGTTICGKTFDGGKFDE